MKKRDAQFVGSVAKAFSVIELFSEYHQELGITDIASLLEMDKSGANRLVSTLHKLGYLARNPQNRRYRLSHKILEVAFGYLSSDILLKFAVPSLIRLSEEINSSAGLCVLDGTDILYLARQERHEFYYPNSLIGERQPAYCTSGGRAILSKLSKDSQRDILNQSSLKSVTQYTETDPNALLKLIDQASEKGYARQFSEYIPLEINLACPIVARQGHPVAAILVSRLVANDAEASAFEAKAAPLLTRAASELSKSMQGLS